MRDMTYCYSVYHDNFRDSIGQCTGIHRRLTGSSPGRTAARASQGIGFASLCVLDRLVRLCKPVIKATMSPFANENRLHFKAFLIFQPNYNKNKRSGQCDYERKSKHSKCSYTCEKTAWVDRDFLAEQQANPVSTHTEKTGRSG